MPWSRTENGWIAYEWKNNNFSALRVSPRLAATPGPSALLHTMHSPLPPRGFYSLTLVKYQTRANLRVDNVIGFIIIPNLFRWSRAFFESRKEENIILLLFKKRKKSWGGRVSNQGPLARRSDAFTTIFFKYIYLNFFRVKFIKSFKWNIECILFLNSFVWKKLKSIKFNIHSMLILISFREKFILLMFDLKFFL